VWNPQKRVWLPLRAAFLELAAIATDVADEPVAVLACRPYLVLLDLASGAPADGAVARQFLLVERFGSEPDDDPIVVFCSAVHRLDPTDSRGEHA